MFKDIKVNGDMITVGKETAAIKDLFISWSDYEDGFHDLVICFKETGDMFGSVSWVAIPEKKIKKMAKELKEITGITDLRKEQVDPDAWMYI